VSEEKEKKRRKNERAERNSHTTEGCFETSLNGIGLWKGTPKIWARSLELGTNQDRETKRTKMYFLKRPRLASQKEQCEGRSGEYQPKTKNDA
jgi:hypothetical protein